VALFASILWVPSAISGEKGGQPWILVDTKALTLRVYSAENRILAHFDNISIGSGGAAETHRRGDETTPRGTFHVSWIDRHGRYGTFYGFDYPSGPIARRAYAEGVISRTELDAILQALRHRRTPPQNTALGGRLGIHGLGSGDLRIHQAVNWTDGCIALTNEEIRKLSRWVGLGTRVVVR